MGKRAGRAGGRGFGGRWKEGKRKSEKVVIFFSKGRAEERKGRNSRSLASLFRRASLSSSSSSSDISRLSPRNLLLLLPRSPAAMVRLILPSSAAARVQHRPSSSPQRIRGAHTRARREEKEREKEKRKSISFQFHRRSPFSLLLLPLSSSFSPSFPTNSPVEEARLLARGEAPGRARNLSRQRRRLRAEGSSFFRFSSSSSIR